MIAGVRNKKTGQDYMANNRDGKKLERSDLHPILFERAEAQDRIIDTTQRLHDSGMTLDDINAMTPEQMRAELAKAGIPETVQGMDTADALRQTNERAKFIQTRDPDADPFAVIRKENAQHGEVAALNDALHDSPGVTHEDLGDYELYTQRLPGGKSKPIEDRAMPRCACCRGVTSGISTHPDVTDSEHYADGQNGKLW